MPSTLSDKHVESSPAPDISLPKHLLTHLAICGLAPLVKSEIILKGTGKSSLPSPLALSHQAKITGDFEGLLAFSCTEGFIKNLTPKNGEQDNRERILHTLSQECVVQFQKEGLEVQLAPLSSSEAPTTGLICVGCPIETKFGEICIYLSLGANELDKLIQMTSQSENMDPRKIRVSAFHMETLFSKISHIENRIQKETQRSASLDQALVEIKKAKRLMSHMKSEPMSRLFFPAKKLATEIAKQQHKQVRFEVRGSDILLDKHLLGFLYGPILHLIRNAVDHGIESQKHRERLGKSPVGLIKCLATFQPQGMKILITDDGAGLDMESIREKALTLGMLSEDQASQLLSEELYPLIFKPNLTTRDSKSLTSGCGLGLHVAQREIEALGGTLRVLSSSHHGTSMELYVPLTDELTAKNPPKRLNSITPLVEDDEQSYLFDELERYLYQFGLLKNGLEGPSSEETFYQAYRLMHSIVGLIETFEWTRLTTFSHHFELLLKAVTEKQIPLCDELRNLVHEVHLKLSLFCKLEYQKAPSPLSDLRRLESRILRELWKSKSSGLQSQNKIGELFVQSFTEILGASNAKLVEFLSSDAYEFESQLKFGLILQSKAHSGGYLGMMVNEKALRHLLGPCISGKVELTPLQDGGQRKLHFETLEEFALLVSRQIIDKSESIGLLVSSFSLTCFSHTSAVITLLGAPTFSYQSISHGMSLSLFGDERFLKKRASASPSQVPMNFHSSMVLKESTHTLVHYLKKLGSTTKLSEVRRASQKIGYSDGVTLLIPIEHHACAMLCISLDAKLHQYLKLKWAKKLKKSQKLNPKIDGVIESFGAVFASRIEKVFQAYRLQTAPLQPEVVWGALSLPPHLKAPQLGLQTGYSAFGNFEIQVLVD